MLSLGSSGHAWLCIVCKAIQTNIDPDGHYQDDLSVRQIFAEGEDWAQKKGIEVPDGDHAQAFIEARNRSDEPVIPHFMRLFCAELTGTKFGPLTLVPDETSVADARGAKESRHPAEPKKEYKGEPHFRVPIAARR